MPNKRVPTLNLPNLADLFDYPKKHIGQHDSVMIKYSKFNIEI